MNANTTTTTRQPRALLLDDDLATLHPLATTLEARGLDVRAATDGVAGTELLLDEVLDLDVLVVDLDLPGRDGAAMLELVRRAGGERELAIVVLATLAGRGLRARLAAMGADAVVEPGEGAAAIADAIERTLARRAAGLVQGGVGARMAEGLRGLVREAISPTRQLALAAA